MKVIEIYVFMYLFYDNSYVTQMHEVGVFGIF